MLRMRDLRVDILKGTHHNEINVKLDDSVDVGIDIGIDETEQVDLGIREDDSEGVDISGNVGGGGKGSCNIQGSE